MSAKSKLRVLISGPLAMLAVSLCWTPAGAAQVDPTPVGEPSFANNERWRAPSANVYVSVREATGFPVSTNAMVKLSCPIAGLNVSGPAEGQGAQIQFRNVPVGDCGIEVSAPGYRTAQDR